MVSGQDEPVGVLAVSQTGSWTDAAIECDIPAGVQSLTFFWQSGSNLKLLEITID